MDKATARVTPRKLLARVRDVMAGAGTAQHRLDQTVSVIASGTGADVCSVYVRRAGDLLELFATKGLKKSAVHSTRLRVGEGLVGVVAARARPLALSDAQHHPSFVFRPETGEEIFHSLMGVPILRGGRVLGVLVLQNRIRRRFISEEVETMQTVAMVLAEMVAGGELIAGQELLPADGIAKSPLQISAARFHAGIGMGVAVLNQPHTHVSRLVAEDAEEEHERVRRAATEMHVALDALLADESLAGDEENRGILESYRMIAEDAGWLGRIGEAIDGGLTAEAAVMKVQNDIRARFSRISDRYLRERVHDMDDLADRLLNHLLGPSAGDEEKAGLPEDVVLFARNMGPAQLLEFDRSRLRAIVLEEGSPTAHVAIIARAMDIPMVGQAKGVMSRVEDGDPVIVDADHANVLIRPGENVSQSFVDSIADRTRQKAKYAALRGLPAITRDRSRISININAGLRIDMPQLEETGADGVGLYRTEIPFMSRSEFPDVASQEKLYKDVVKQAGGKPVIFRTVDIGGDKILPYWEDSPGANPAMGWRAIRICLDRPAILRHQLRALIRSTKGGELRLMFPMIAEVAEFDAAQRLFEMEMERARKQRRKLPKKVLVGAMLEVPSLVFQLPTLLSRVDFISIGSNDLFQFLFASDRGDSRLSERYDTMSPATLSILRTIISQCDKASVPVSLCGEMAGNPIDAMALVGLGLRSLSMSSSSIGPIKAMIRSLDLGPLCNFMESLFLLPDHSVREKLREFARDHGVMI
ncbi:MAG: phosphoenolpyruvate--protein phosphotransferase [Rhodospirillales bacterium]|nr:phosphoenolpyruvate--protein phosphotransferase [Rhodospirillales bacterium]